MKKILFTALLALLATGVGAQEQQKEEGYRFTDVKTLLLLLFLRPDARREQRQKGRKKDFLHKSHEFR